MRVRERLEQVEGPLRDAIVVARCAARCDDTKQSVLSNAFKRMQHAPLLPMTPSAPVPVASIATSLQLSAQKPPGARGRATA